ncbi:MAG: hypothetical protein A3E36_03865 [Candidatus Andersenbacteria bacterium RIFCSPHIGHO2_12_FULL_45_11b]|uniref:DUF5666 domain-containing protein n=1 Tax=Candidatus Andersenbacteria bacterium RIFCSPHIGHO2_12_FULL_45_11b TaxID=1797282 RepID=A0A1G1X9Q1_9BACT|nr:MAG: hypothetical protein A3E36_03865 [Candidatus Andersenbacteria bacterium RIFCSPHIGHO2_12_FULL_45_11b]
MNTRSFNKLTSIATLVVFLATPSLALAQTNNNSSANPFGAINPMMLMLMMQGGGGAGAGAGGSGGGGGTQQAGQMLMLAGILSGNMGLAIAGLITSMLGGLASGAGGGAGNTPQQGSVDERYVAPGQAAPFGGGAGANSPYFNPPSGIPGSGGGAAPSPAPAAACSKSLFIVKDTTATPASTKPYPNALTIPQSDCVLVLNADSAPHSLGGNSVAALSSQIFHFASKKVYNMCIDNSTTACTAITVQ